MRPIPAKLGLKPGQRVIAVGAPEPVRAVLAPPGLVLADRLDGAFDAIMAFVVRSDALDAEFARLKPHVRAGGKLWACWPKARQLGTDLDIRRVIAIGYEHGMVESTALSIDAVWSALKFTHPRPGKRYANSYGTLPWQREPG